MLQTLKTCEINGRLYEFVEETDENLYESTIDYCLTCVGCGEKLCESFGGFCFIHTHGYWRFIQKSQDLISIF